MSANDTPPLTDEEKRLRIMDAARNSLSAKGFHGTTLDDISRTSFMPKRVLQRYFRNKDLLLNEATVSASRDSLHLVQALLQEGPSGQGTVHQLIETIVPFFSASRLFNTGRFNIEWWAWAARNEIGLEGFRQTWKEWRQALASVVRAEVGEGPSDDDVMAMAGLMLAIYNGLILHATLEGDELDIERIMRFQQYGWEGIFSRVKDQGANGEPSSQDKPARSGEPKIARRKS